ncbi:MAG: PqiC family protein [Gammaproteobacteria bacterium]
MSIPKIVWLCSVLWVAGCSTAPVTRYYQIQPVAGLAAGLTGVNTANPAIALGIGPIRLPPYLDRTKIVLEQQDNELKLAQYSEWAGPLDDNISSVLAREIGALIGTDQISRYPWPPETTVDYRVEVDLIRLHAVANHEVVLAARWVIKDSDRQPVAGQLNSFSAPIRPGTPGAPTAAEEPAALNPIVTAHAEVLQQLARTIATALQDLTTSR